MSIELERVADSSEIEQLLDDAFGKERLQKTVYRLRDGRPPVADLCFVIRDGDGAMRGSLRFWTVCAGSVVNALLLGPIAVRPADRGYGYGRALMWHGLAEAKRYGYGLVILVGDEPYYGQFGFRRHLAQSLTLPGPYEPDRLLALELSPGAAAQACGAVTAPHASVAEKAAGLS